MELNFQSSVPLYIQLKDEIVNDIAKGSFKTGDKLPTEMELSQELKVSRITVRKAMEELENSGVVIRHQGKGTFVKSFKIQRPLSATPIGFSELTKKQGMQPGAKTIRNEMVQADPEDEKVLGVLPGGQVYLLERIRTADGIPVSFEISRFTPYYAFIANENLDGDVSLFGLLKQKYDIEFQISRRTFSIVFCSEPVILEAMKLSAGYPLLLFRNCVYDKQGYPAYRSINYIRGDKFTFTV